MSDITLLYYTANRIHEYFAENVRKHLIESANGKPIISVSLKPIDFGNKNIHQDGEPSSRNMHQAILLGAKACNTQYIACCEDDTLYVPEHFGYKFENAFAYNMNQWHLRKDTYFYRGYKVSWVCIAPTELMIKTIERRFRDYPDNVDIKLRLPQVIFQTDIPPITFRHQNSLNGVPSIPKRYKRVSELPYWGKAQELWNKFYGNEYA